MLFGAEGLLYLYGMLFENKQTTGISTCVLVFNLSSL